MSSRVSLCLCALLAVAAVRADTVLLADGTEHEGRVVKETDQDVTFAIRMGGLRGSIVIPKAEIISLRYGEIRPDQVAEDGAKLKKLAEAETEPAKAAQAWLRVGDYFDRHPGYSAHAKSSYEKVLLFDTNQPLARARLGFIKDEKGAWKKPEPVKKDETKAADAAPVPAPAAPEVKNEALNAKLADAQKAAAQDEVVIGLRKDAAAVKRLLDDEADRIAVERQRLRRDREARSAYDYNPYGGEYFLLSDGAYYYPPGSVVIYGGNGIYGYSGNGGYGYGSGTGFGYGGSHYHSSSGFSFGFSGGSGNFHYAGSFNGGNHHGARF